MKKAQVISVLIALSLSLLQIPASKGAVDEWVTGFVDEDLFFAANLFEGVDMVYLQGDGMRIIGYYWFEGPIMQAGRYIKEAYLEVRTPSIGVTDTDAMMMIYGRPSGKGGTPSYAEDPNVLNGPYTTNSYQVNLSSFVGVGDLHNITVTRILREINQGYYFWDGHDIAFVTVSHDGHDEERSISSLESGYPAKLYIHYGQPDPGDDEYPDWLPDGGVFVEDYRNYTIWKKVNLVNSTMSFKWTNSTGGDEGYFHTTIERGVADVWDRDLITEPGDYNLGVSSQDTIVRLGDFIACMYDFGEVELWYSWDDGATWTGVNLNDQYTDLAPHTSQTEGSMSLDENGTVHMVWNTYTPSYPANSRSVYSNFTVLSNSTIDYFDGYKDLGPLWSYVNIEADRYGRVHVLYSYDTDVWYKIRFINGTWSGNEAIWDNTDSTSFTNVDVADMPGDYPLARFVYYRGWVGVSDIQQTIRDPDGTLTHVILEGTDTHYPATANDVKGNCSWATWTDDPGGQRIEMRGYNFTTETLLATVAVSKTTEANRYSDIGIGEDGIGYVVWFSQWFERFYCRRFDLDTGVFIETANGLWITDLNIGNALIQITPWQVAGYANTTYYIADMNGTLIDTFTITDDTNGTQEAEDFVDEDVIGYPDPEDPNPPGWEDTGYITVHRFKLIFFMIGMILFLGTPMFGFYARPDAATWIIIFFCMFCGVSLLWALQTM